MSRQGVPPFLLPVTGTAYPKPCLMGSNFRYSDYQTSRPITGWFRWDGHLARHSGQARRRSHQASVVSVTCFRCRCQSENPVIAIRSFLSNPYGASYPTFGTLKILLLGSSQTRTINSVTGMRRWGLFRKRSGPVFCGRRQRNRSKNAVQVRPR